MGSKNELRQRLYCPPILLKFDLHHNDETDSASPVDIAVTVDRRDSSRPVPIVSVVGANRPEPLPPDDRGCLAPCFPACHTPVYRAGQVFTGHLLVRPVATRLVISGVTVHVCGRCQTDWREANVRWKASRDFFVDKQSVIRNRLITLDRRWHRFDIEYQLPADLPSSFKSTDGKLVYYASASVAVVHITSEPSGSESLGKSITVECRAHEARFHVEGRTDVATFPAHLQVPAHRTAQLCHLSEHREPTSHQVGTPLGPHCDANSSADKQQRSRHQKHQGECRRRTQSLGDINGRLRLAGESCATVAASIFTHGGRNGTLRTSLISAELPQFPLSTSQSEVDEGVIDDCERSAGFPSVVDSTDCCLLRAGLSLDRRVFVVGDRILADITVDNQGEMPAVCTVQLQQVLAFQADYGLERRKGKQVPMYQHYRRHIRLVVRDVGQSSSTSHVSVQPCQAIRFQRVFCLPRRLTPSAGVPSASRRAARHHQQLVDWSDDVTAASPSSLSRGTVKLQTESLISVKYFCKLVVTPQWSRHETLVVPIEVKIGTCDSSRTFGARTGGFGGSLGSTLESTEDSWAADTNDLQNEPLNYEDYFS